jgi:hypothetical protein
MTTTDRNPQSDNEDTKQKDDEDMTLEERLAWLRERVRAIFICITILMLQ